MDPRPLLNLLGDRLHTLPLLVVYLTDGCNSKCITCDVWRLPRCNAPHISAVVEVDGSARPCYFLPVTGQLRQGMSLREALNGEQSVTLLRQVVSA